jgi:hypothetical protein
VIILETYVMVAETIKNEEATEAKRLAEDEAARLEAELGDDDDDDDDDGGEAADGTSSPPKSDDPLSPKSAAAAFEDDTGESNLDGAMTSSCFCFAPNNGFRKLCMQLSDSHAFELVIMGCIFLNCITMSLETPDLDPDSTLSKWLWRSGFFFTLVFTLEAIVKMIGQKRHCLRHLYIKLIIFSKTGSGQT